MGDSSALYGVRLPEDLPPGVAYLEVEQGSFVGRACPVLVMPLERYMAAAEVVQLLRGGALAACTTMLGAPPDKKRASREGLMQTETSQPLQSHSRHQHDRRRHIPIIDLGVAAQSPSQPFSLM